MPATNEALNDGRYRIQKRFTLNGSTNVYNAYDTVRKTDVVVKETVIQLGKVTTQAQQDQIRHAFVNQAKRLAEIEHPVLLNVHDFFFDVGRNFLVLESIDGDPLGEALDGVTTGFRLDEVLEWADQILDGLHYLHTALPPIIHQNIRPNNLKLTSDGRIKLLAYGLTDDSGVRISTNISPSPMESEMNYSPLEQIWPRLDPASKKVIEHSYDEQEARSLTEPLDARSDIYSLGATLYHLLTGRKPVDPLERSIELLDGNSDPLVNVTTLAPSVPIEISEVIARALSIKRHERYEAAAIMRQSLRTASFRAKERELEEEHEQLEAAEMLKATRNQKISNPPPQTKTEVPAQTESEPDKAALLEKKLKEAEEMRLLAEQRAREAERLLQEKEREKAKILAEPHQAKDAAAETIAKEAAPQAPPSEKIKEAAKAPTSFAAPESSPADHSHSRADVQQQRKASSQKLSEKQPDEMSEKFPEAGPLQEDLPIDGSQEAKPEVSISAGSPLAGLNREDETSAADAFGSVVSHSVAEEVHTSSAPFINKTTESLKEEEKEVFSGDFLAPQNARSSFPVALAAGAAVVLIAVAIGVWFVVTGNSSKDAQPSQTQSTVSTGTETKTNQPQSETSSESLSEQTAETVPDSGANVSEAEPSQPAATTAAESLSGAPANPAGDQNAAQRRAAARPTADKKDGTNPGAAKTPSDKKKTVTVDDLINDTQ